MSLFRGLVSSLPPGYDIVEFDNRGAGCTDKPDAPYSIEMMADDTAGLLRALGIARTNVLAVSMGGRIALELGLKHSEMVNSLILVSTSARLTKEARSALQFRIGVLSKRITGSGVFGGPAQPYYAFKRQLDASGSYDCTDRLGEIRAPTLVLHGEKDRLAPPRVVEEMAKGIAGSRVRAFKGGHLFFLWDSEGFADAVSGFLDGVS